MEIKANGKNSCHCCSSASTLVCLDGINIRWKRLEQNEFGRKYKTRYKESSRNLDKENNWRRIMYFVASSDYQEYYHYLPTFDPLTCIPVIFHRLTCSLFSSSRTTSCASSHVALSPKYSVIVEPTIFVFVRSLFSRSYDISSPAPQNVLNMSSLPLNLAKLHQPTPSLAEYAVRMGSVGLGVMHRLPT